MRPACVQHVSHPTFRQPAASPDGPRPVHRGFAVIELLLLTIASILALAIFLIWSGDSRRNARLGQDLASLRHYGMGTVAYAADNADLMWGFSWKAGTTAHGDPDLRTNSSALEAGASQAVQILRDRAGREDINRIPFWLPQAGYSHLVMADYLGDSLPDSAAVSSGDEHRIRWRDDPAGFDLGNYSPRPYSSASASNNDKRWPYSASWQLGVAFFDLSTVLGTRITWGSTQSQYNIPGAVVFGQPRLADIAFPSQKAMMIDRFQRHHGDRQAFHAYREARVPVLAADGAVAVRTSGEGNPPWAPNSPSLPSSSVGTYAYQWPSTPILRWEPAPLNGMTSDVSIVDRFMWTRGGLLGRDFDGPEIDTGQW